MSKIQVPEGMSEAVANAIDEARGGPFSMRDLPPSRVRDVAVEAALRWLSENPIVPTREQANELWKIALEQNPDKNETTHAAKNVALAWGRRMFLVSEPEQSVSLRPGKYIVEVGGGLDPRVTPYEYGCVAVSDEFRECDSCRAKSGSPVLCAGCLHNRQVIEDMRKASR